MTHLAATLNAFSLHLACLHEGDFERSAGQLRLANRYSILDAKDAGFHFIPECLFGWFAESFAKLTKRAAKLGTPAPTFTRHGIDLQRVDIEVGRWFTRAYVMISLEGEAPRVGNARLLARIEHTPAGNIVAVAPGVDADPAWSTTPQHCDHCNTKRNRIDTFAVEVDGVVKFVGRNCLADFVRSADVEAALSLWKFLEVVSRAAGGDPDADGWIGWSHEGPTPEWFVACAARAVRAGGYVGRKQEGQSTADAAEFAAGIKPTDPPSRVQAWKDAQPEEVDIALAARAAKWIAATTEVGGFIGNCRVVMAQTHLKPRHYGLAAAVVVGYRKQMEREVWEAEKAARAAARASEAPAGHFGEVGKRYDLKDLKIVMVRSWEGNYGTTTLVKLTDADGRAFTWFASGEKSYEPGQVVSGKATVKKHDTDEKYGEQTVLTRCKFEVAA